MFMSLCLFDILEVCNFHIMYSFEDSRTVSLPTLSLSKGMYDSSMYMRLEGSYLEGYNY